MMLRNMAASCRWDWPSHNGPPCIKTWSQGTAVPALVAHLHAAPPPPQQILLHVLKTLVNFAATGLAPCYLFPYTYTLVLWFPLSVIKALCQCCSLVITVYGTGD